MSKTPPMVAVPPPDIAVQVRDLAAAYGPVVAIDALDLDVRRGTVLGLIGPNGAGKSTLLRAMLGLAPVVRGSVIVLGRQPSQSRHEVAYVPQADTLDPDFPVSALQVVLMGRYRRIGWLRRPRRTDIDAATSALELVGLRDHASRRFGALSGGQRQRVLLARAIAQDAALLLLDEPFNGVDIATQDALVGAIGDLRGSGATVVMSTHDLAMARAVCDDACVLNHRSFGAGPVHQVLTADRLQVAYGLVAERAVPSSSVAAG